jgi:threonine dehydrogenase-like Zn-dependent dehydrogenase
VPPGLPAEEAALLPNMETAVTFLLDGAPLLGERVLVLGQGIVGLLTTALLARLPLGALVTADRYARRRELALRLGARQSLDPGSPVFLEQAGAALQARASIEEGADLAYELSGSPEALNQALALTGYSGRVVIGSWYGAKPVALDLGGRYHRSRMRLIASQVSRIAPELSGRWTTRRRLEVAWRMLAAVRPSVFITHRFPQARAAEAYELLDRRPDEALQVVLVYPEGGAGD